MAYRTDGTANFNFFINRQGPRGPQGIQGPEGFSPNVQVEEDQGNIFTLRVTNKDNFFITSNLREHKEDRGGDYIRYDRAGQLMYIGDPDFATTVKAGEVRLSTVDDLTTGSDTVALTPKVYKDDITNKVNIINTSIADTKTELQGDIAATNLKIDNLDANNVKLTGDQEIDGLKSFKASTTFLNVVTDDLTDSTGKRFIHLNAGDGTYDSLGSGRKIKTNSAIEVNGSITATNIESLATLKCHSFETKNASFTGTMTSYGQLNAIDIRTAGIINSQTNKKYLTQGTVTAGDNITIDETVDGIKISGQAGGGGTNAGLEGDYCSKYGIVDCPNGILTEGTKKVTLKAGVVMQLTETDSLTTNASDMVHDITSTVDFDLFYTSGSLLEATQIVFSEQEPNNGTTGVLAWYNGIQWQFKSNDTGNVWKSAPAVRLAHIHITNGNITRIDYIGNRHLNKVIPVTTDTEQTISGAKILDNNLYVNNPNTASSTKSISTEKLYCNAIELGKVWTGKNSDYTYDNGLRKITAIAKNGVAATMIACNTAYNKNVIQLGVSDGYEVIIPVKARTYGNKKFLVQGSVTAGSDNLVISETTDGIQITCNAPTNEQIGQILESIADLSTKINNLTDRVRALEEQIDGGIA